MTSPGGDVVRPTLGVDSNVSSTANSGLTPVSRAVLNTPAMRELAEAMTEPPDPGAVNRRWGIVAAFSGPPNYTVDVTVGGVLLPGLAYDAAYTPTVNEVVMLDVVGTDTVVIGTTAPGGWRTGEIEPTFLSTPKAGALFCQGQTLSRTTYANLWSWVSGHALNGTGKPFGNGDGSTTFTLPDMRGRVPIGAGTLGTDTYNVGDLPGAARVTLATNQMPSHNHSVAATATQAAHTHSFSATSQSTGSHTHTGSTGNDSVNHTHQVPSAYTGETVHSHGSAFPGYAAEGPNPGAVPAAVITTTGVNTWHTHAFTSDAGGTHTHTVSGTSGSTTATSTVTVTQSTVGGTTPVDIRQPAFVVNWLIYV